MTTECLYVKVYSRYEGTVGGQAWVIWTQTGPKPPQSPPPGSVCSPPASDQPDTASQSQPELALRDVTNLTQLPRRHWEVDPLNANWVKRGQKGVCPLYREESK